VEYSEGFGLDNLATRLQLQYHDNQIFEYGKHQNHYKVTFKLKASIMENADLKKNIQPNQTSNKQWLPA
jgi:hypothetical protein